MILHDFPGSVLRAHLSVNLVGLRHRHPQPSITHADCFWNGVCPRLQLLDRLPDAREIAVYASDLLVLILLFLNGALFQIPDLRDDVGQAAMPSPVKPILQNLKALLKVLNLPLVNGGLLILDVEAGEVAAVTRRAGHGTAHREVHTGTPLASEFGDQEYVPTLTARKLGLIRG